MPEISEVRIMAEFINKIASEAEYFCGISKNPEHKSKTSLDLPFKLFRLNAFTRGKELKLRFINGDLKHPLSNYLDLVFTMGMSGNWNYSKDVFSIPKHTHLMIADDKGGILGLHDVRRFARWDWRGWNLERGPDPDIDFEEFQYFISTVFYKEKEFEKPIYEVLMNQKYFNGIGNYLRAEILGRIDLNPLMPANEYIAEAGNLFFETIHRVIHESYILGGGQIKDWKNQADLDKKKSKEFQEWMQFYFNKIRCVPIKDRTGRTFWLDKKWKYD